jgi:23S rRNA pseudouridine1911/1915/1917 synthase
MSSRERLRVVVPPEAQGLRFDVALTRLVPQYSRARLQRWMRAGLATSDGLPVEPSARARGGEVILLDPQPETETRAQAQDIVLDLIHEDESLVVINKPPGLVVHPAAGNPDGTLLNALLHRYPSQGELPRAGIVHRLDKDTSGALVVARTLAAHNSLIRQLAERSIKREYLALVWGRVANGGLIDAPVGRHPVQRQRMAVVRSGRSARTHYTPLARYPAHTLLKLQLDTGRTHQIRVHMAHLRHPVVGDPTYGAKSSRRSGLAGEAEDRLKEFVRQALHAWRLTLRHPQQDKDLCFEASPPEDFRQLLEALKPFREPPAGVS